MKRLLIILLHILSTVHTAKNDSLNQVKAPGHIDIHQLIDVTQSKLSEMWRELSDSNVIPNRDMTQRGLIQFFIRLDENVTEAENRTSDRDFHGLSSLWTYAQTSADVVSINSYYDAFRRLQREVKSGKILSKHALTDLAETYTQENDFGLVRILERLHRHVTHSDPSNLFELTLDEEQTCQFKESRQQLLYNLYRTVLMADYKGYTMLQFSYMILKLYDKGNFIVESEREAKNFDARIKGKVNAIKSVLANANRDLYNCDPIQYVEDVNYIAITKLLQGYIENEINFNQGHTCWENCAHYVQTEYYGCYKNEFCNKQRSCRGKIVECKYVRSDMNICKSSDPQRRYDWIEYDNGEVLGNKGKCLVRNLHKVDSWWKYLFWHCSYCMCLCDEPGADSDRYFNLRPVTSNLEENRVVTGVRIRKHNRIIHLQIQHGVLGPYGEIDVASIMWKPIDTYKLTDEDAENGVDYHTMTWLDRTLDIDEVVGPTNHVVTGARFRKIGSHLNLEVRVTPINFTTGHVFPEVHSVWLGNDNTELSTHTPRRELVLTNPDIPIRYKQHVIDSEHNQFVRFQASSLKHDAAQNTVPFLDSQPITSNGFPLSGLGLVHRGITGSGGFVAPKLITFDMTPHIY